MDRPLDPELVRRAWSAITLRVAWELVRGGVAVRAPTLRAARDHAIWRMGGARDIAEAEARAARATEEFLARAEGRWGHLEDDEDLSIPVPVGWATAILDALEPTHEAVFRLHYADGAPIEEVAPRAGIDPSEVRAAREAVREVAREVLADTLPQARSWEIARLDRMVARIATATDGNCPGAAGLATDAGRAHAERCPRCSKALRLMREGLLGPADLAPPAETGVLPIGEVDLVCVLVHPDARRHMKALARSFGTSARLSAAGDELLVQGAACPELEPLLADAAERGAPAREHLRAARMTVPGRWTRPAVIGPGLARVRARAASLGWGEVEGVAPLPEMLPPPPSLARWWVALAMVATLSVCVAAWFWSNARTEGEGVALAGDALPGGVRFDTDDLAYAFVVATSPGGPRPVFVSARPSDKGDIATGDGAFLVTGGADRWILVASMKRLDDFVTVLTSGPVGESADGIAERLRARWPEASVRVLDGVAGEAAPASAAPAAAGTDAPPVAPEPAAEDPKPEAATPAEAPPTDAKPTEPAPAAVAPEPAKPEPATPDAAKPADAKPSDAGTADQPKPSRKKKSKKNR